jgi:hypothetical protein
VFGVVEFWEKKPMSKFDDVLKELEAIGAVGNTTPARPLAEEVPEIAPAEAPKEQPRVEVSPLTLDREAAIELLDAATMMRDGAARLVATLEQLLRPAEQMPEPPAEEDDSVDVEIDEAAPPAPPPAPPARSKNPPIGDVFPDDLDHMGDQGGIVISIPPAVPLPAEP